MDRTGDDDDKWPKEMGDMDGSGGRDISGGGKGGGLGPMGRVGERGTSRLPLGASVRPDEDEGAISLGMSMPR